MSLTCKRCKVEKETTEFAKHHKHGYQAWCRSCRSDYYKERKEHAAATQKAWRESQTEEERERRSEMAYNTHLRRQFGIDRTEYDELLVSQEDGCAICGRSSSGSSQFKRLVVDHDHTTGKVRGLLCDPCNRGIGLLQDDPSVIQKAIDYLNKHKE